MTILMSIIRELWLTKGKVQTFLSWRASVGNLDINKTKAEEEQTEEKRKTRNVEALVKCCVNKLLDFST